MGFDTGLSLTAFNVVKYLLVFVLYDFIVRLALQGFLLYWRRLDLFYGRSSVIDRYRVDRHSFSSLLSFRRVPRTFFWILLTLSAYAAELLLELSTKPALKYVSVPGPATIVSASQSLCSLRDVIAPDAILGITQVANDCVEQTKVGRYVLYEPHWQRRNGMTQPLCVKAGDNKLASGPSFYQEIDYDEVEQWQFLLQENSYGANGDRHKAFTTLRITRDDVVFTSEHATGSTKVIRGFFKVSVPNTNKIVCYGDVFGAEGEGMFRLQMFACSAGKNGTISNSHLIVLTGSGVVQEDVSDVRTKGWEIFIASDIYGHERAIYKYAKDLVVKPWHSMEAAAMALTMTGTGEEIVEKRAVVYRHCDKIRVPLPTDTLERKVFPKASAKEKVSVVVQQWAIAIILGVPLILSSSSLILNYVADRRQLPTKLLGEYSIALRWLHEKQTKRLYTAVSDEVTTEAFPESSPQSPSDSTKKESIKAKQAKAFMKLESRNGFDHVTVVSSTDYNRD